MQKVLFENVGPDIAAKLLEVVEVLGQMSGVSAEYTRKTDGLYDVTVELPTLTHARAFMDGASLYCCEGRLVE